MFRLSIPFKKYGGILLICVLFFLLGIPLLNNMIIYTPDSARYLIWANSLAKFQGFIDATEPEATRYVIHAPFYSLLLVPSALLFPFSVIAAKATTLIIGCALLIAFFLLLKRSVGEKYALLGALLLALNPMIFVYSTQMLSDVPFVLCLVLFFYFTAQILERNATRKIDFALISVLTIGILMREIGLTLLISAVLFFIWKKQYRRALFFFFTPLIFYGLWFLRNEIIVAGFENPPFRNSQIFIQNIYTTADANLMQEMLERIRVNFTVYLKHVGKLIFLSNEQSYSYLSASNIGKFIEVVQKIFAPNYWIVTAITSVFTALGVWMLRKSPLLLSIGLFVGFYCAVILVYPVNDIRFLLPIAVIILYLFLHGIKFTIKEWRASVNYRAIRYAIVALLLYLVCINLNLLQATITNNWQYSKSFEELYQKIKLQKIYSETFTKPFQLAAQWIMENSDSSDVVISRKELALWLKGRKVLLSNPRSSTVALDRRLRDYNVRYLVAVKWCLQISEYENLLVQSKNYDFNLVHSVGDIEVYEVKQKDYSAEAKKTAELDSSVRSQYREAIQIIEIEPLRAKAILKKISYEYDDFPIVRYNIAVAKEFIGELDTADIIFDGFRSMPQAGFFLQQVWFHRKNISLLKEVNENISLNKKAELYNNIAGNYWALGYQIQAMKMLEKSLSSDSSLKSANIYSVLFPLLMDDTVQVRNRIKIALTTIPENNYIKNTYRILNYYDSLNYSQAIKKQKQMRMEIVKTYLAMNLTEYAIDELINISKLYPNDEEVLFQLGVLLEMKRCYFSALKYYERVLQLNPVHAQTKQNIFLLNRRMQN